MVFFHPRLPLNPQFRETEPDSRSTPTGTHKIGDSSLSWSGKNKLSLYPVHTSSSMLSVSELFRSTEKLPLLSHWSAERNPMRRGETRSPKCWLHWPSLLFSKLHWPLPLMGMGRIYPGKLWKEFSWVRVKALGQGIDMCEICQNLRGREDGWLDESKMGVFAHRNG